MPGKCRRLHARLAACGLRRAVSAAATPSRCRGGRLRGPDLPGALLQLGGAHHEPARRKVPHVVVHIDAQREHVHRNPGVAAGLDGLPQCGQNGRMPGRANAFSYSEIE
ncbi:hypothetical protein GCM10010191_59260 [Actinomadura vinacea]|uniref:Uncharacterized protein n=1 Tax=Actinomadura vinacea TaxID=115336 RepID=A0ABP5WZ88_9ACTN